MKGKKVLDLGCCEGNLLRKDPRLIYGIDVNKTLIEKLKKEKFLVKEGEVTDIPFGNQYFDVIHCSNVIEHLFPGQAHKMFLEMKRVLRKEGVIILITPMPKKIWNTFGHIKPYPPVSITKLFREVSRESFDSISDMEINSIFYFGSWGTNKLTFLISTLAAQITPFFRGSYLMVIQRNE